MWQPTEITDLMGVKVNFIGHSNKSGSLDDLQKFFVSVNLRRNRCIRLNVFCFVSGLLERREHFLLIWLKFMRQQRVGFMVSRTRAGI